MIPTPYRRVVRASLRSWENHRDRWTACEACPLALTRSRVVLFRGRLPAEVLFLGEAPGDSEDSLGAPFVGESGDFLQSVLWELSGVIPSSGIFYPGGERTTYAITNIVGCRPPRVDGRFRQPTKEEASSCAPRLKEFLKICRPRLVVCLGNVATNNIPSKLPRVELKHPAWVLRQPPAKFPYHRKRFLVTLKEALRGEVCQG